MQIEELAESIAIALVDNGTLVVKADTQFGASIEDATAQVRASVKEWAVASWALAEELIAEGARRGHLAQPTEKIKPKIGGK